MIRLNLFINSHINSPFSNSLWSWHQWSSVLFRLYLCIIKQFFKLEGWDVRWFISWPFFFGFRFPFQCSQHFRVYFLFSTFFSRIRKIFMVCDFWEAKKLCSILDSFFLFFYERWVESSLSLLEWKIFLLFPVELLFGLIELSSELDTLLPEEFQLSS